MADSPIQLIIRFTISTPDLPLLISSPSTTTTLTLKQRIRAYLPPSASSNRLRLIHAGKVLSDAAFLSYTLHISPPPLGPKPDAWTNKRSSPGPHDVEKTAKSKGKQPVRDNDIVGQTEPDETQAVPRIYVHWSIGDPLSPQELQAEAHAATISSTDNAATEKSQRPSNTAGQPPPPLSPPTNVTTVPSQHEPLGFDRLLSANLTREDVASLRAQFLALQQHTHTPDTMPRGRELRLLEDRWLDSDAFGPPTSASSGSHPSGDGGGATTVAEGGGIMSPGNTGNTWGLGVGAGLGEDSGLEDMLIGNLMGFFWPLGALCWLLREEGVWTQRRQIAVFTGMVVNAAFGFWRMAG